MKVASISEIKKELKSRDPQELLELCLRLGRFKKENKELLTYLLYESADERTYISSVKGEIEKEMKEVNKTQLYYARKNLRKILRMLDRFIRYSGNKETETELRLCFCRGMIENNIPFERTKALRNIFDGQTKKIRVAMKKLHEDIQFDIRSDLEDLLSSK